MHSTHGKHAWAWRARYPDTVRPCQPSTLTTQDAPLLVNPWPSWHKYSWMAEFVRQIPNAQANTIETVKLAIAARELLLKHAKKYDIDFNVEHRGILHFYSNEKDFRHAEGVNKLYAEVCEGGGGGGVSPCTYLPYTLRAWGAFSSAHPLRTSHA